MFFKTIKNNKSLILPSLLQFRFQIIKTILILNDVYIGRTFILTSLLEKERQFAENINPIGCFLVLGLNQIQFFLSDQNLILQFINFERGPSTIKPFELIFTKKNQTIFCLSIFLKNNLFKYRSQFQMYQKINWKFERQYYVPHERALYVCGNVNELGCWDPNRAIRMKWSQNDIWKTNVVIEKHWTQYKFFEGGYHNPYQGGIRWQEGGNRVLKSEELTNHFSVMSVSVSLQKILESQQINKQNQQIINNITQYINKVSPSFVGIRNLHPNEKSDLLHLMSPKYGSVCIQHYVEHMYESAILYLSSQFDVIDTGFICLNFERKHLDQKDDYLIYSVLRNHFEEHLLVINAPAESKTEDLASEIIMECYRRIIEQDVNFQGGKIKHCFLISNCQKNKSCICKTMKEMQFTSFAEPSIFYKGSMKVKKIQNIVMVEQFKASDIYLE